MRKTQAHVVNDPEHIRMSVASAKEVEIRLKDRTVIFATICERSFDYVVIRPWGVRRLRRIALADIKLCEPVSGLTWTEFANLRDKQAAGVRLTARNRQRRRTCASEPSE